MFAGFHVSCDVDVVHTRNGKILNKQRIHNIVVTQGINYLRAMIGSTGTDRANYIGLSSATSTPAASSTELDATVYTSAIDTGLARAQGTYTAGGNGVFTMAKTFTAASTGPEVVGSAGLYTTSSGSSLFAGVALNNSVTMYANDSITITWTVTFS